MLRICRSAIGGMEEDSKQEPYRVAVLVGAFALWVNWSKTFSKLSDWMDAGLRGEFDE